MVTSVIQHRVHVGTQAQYETWLQEITPAAQHFPRHQGTKLQGWGLISSTSDSLRIVATLTLFCNGFSTQQGFVYDVTEINI